MTPDEKENYLLEVDNYLKDSYLLWEKFGFKELTKKEKYEVPEIIASVYEGDHVCELAAACQCFFLFRKAHEKVEENTSQATLLGDYLFSKFSNYLIPVDSTKLIDEFADLLKFEILEEVRGRNGFNMENYKNFLVKIPFFIDVDV